MRRPLLFLPLARFHVPYEPVDQISAIQGWLASFGLQQETQFVIYFLHLAHSIPLRTKH